jgi:hypothetical protein
MADLICVYHQCHIPPVRLQDRQNLRESQPNLSFIVFPVGAEAPGGGAILCQVF